MPSRIAEAARLLAERKAEEEALSLRKQKKINDRKKSAQEAIDRLMAIRVRLFQSIMDEAGEEKSDPRGDNYEFNKAVIQLSIRDRGFGERPQCPGLNWDVLASAAITVAIRDLAESQIYGRSANLFFGRLSKNDGYRWWEVEFIPFRQNGYVPCNLVFAHTVVELFDLETLEAEIAANPVPIDGEGEDSFIIRWKEFFGSAAMFEFNQCNPFESPPSATPLSRDYYLAD